MMTKECESCGIIIQIEDNDPDIILMPYPHIECPNCGEWISLF